MASQNPTDAELRRMERKVNDIYRDSAKELRQTVEAYWQHYGDRLTEMQAQLANGEIDEAYYRQWVRNNVGRGERWEALRDEIARRASDANQVAAAYINDRTPGIYSLSANRAAYTIEQAGHNVDFTLINEQAVRNLAQGHEVNNYEFQVSDGQGGYTYRRLQPNYVGDYAWNSDRIERQLTLGILAGDGIKDFTERFLSIMGSNRSAAIRNARTAVTSAQNAGTMATMQAARDMGIRVKKKWLSTNDDRTRESHVEMDGEEAEIDDNFSNGLAYPGDPSGEPAEVYNCRCTMEYVIPGVNADADPTDEEVEKWVEEKEAEAAEEQAEEQVYEPYSDRVLDDETRERADKAFEIITYDDVAADDVIGSAKRETDSAGNKYTSFWIGDVKDDPDNLFGCDVFDTRKGFVHRFKDYIEHEDYYDEKSPAEFSDPDASLRIEYRDGTSDYILAGDGEERISRIKWGNVSVAYYEDSYIGFGWSKERRGLNITASLDDGLLDWRTYDYSNDDPNAAIPGRFVNRFRKKKDDEE